MGKEGPEFGSTPSGETDEARQKRWNEENAMNLARHISRRSLGGIIRSLPSSLHLGGLGKTLRIGR